MLRGVVGLARLAAVAWVCGAGWCLDAGADVAPILPPAQPWNGASRALVAHSGDAWITPCEASGMTRTPRYDETVAWLRKLCDAAPELEMQSLGRSPEGREIWMVIATRAPAFTREALRASGKPMLFAQAGIHAGEIDGKDAGLMLLRDISVAGKKRDLLDRANLLFVPIFNVDGHERFSAFTRINQRGPIEAGWRTTSRNLNLNRDYAKLDAPETRALVHALDVWDPDLYLDLHVTDGADYQYDITWGYNGEAGWSPQIVRWLDRSFTPAVRRDLERMGHVPGPFVWPFDGRDLQKGVVTALSSPRLSNGYGDARHVPTVLVENHSLKSYEQRVLGTYVLLESAMRTLGKEGGALRRAVRADRERRAPRLTLDWQDPKPTDRPIKLHGVEARLVPSSISGGLRQEWTGKRVTLELPDLQATEAKAVASRPRAYWIPAAWSDVADRLALHGISMQRAEAPREIEVEMYRITSVKYDSVAFEGHVRVTPKVKAERRRQSFAAGSVRVPTDQPLGDLAMLLLEPESPDSFLQWGFFHEILQATEYVEGYIMEPMAEKMLADDPKLRDAFTKKLLEDPAFAANPDARLQWFYHQTPYVDPNWRLYPIGRE